jgi:hypothetical protein
MTRLRFMDVSLYHALLIPVPYAQCQQRVSSITQQLHDGVRFLDLRMRVIEDDLISELLIREVANLSVSRSPK